MSPGVQNRDDTPWPPDLPAKRHVSQSLEMSRRVTPNAWPVGHTRRTPGYAVTGAAVPLRVTQDAIDSPRLRGRERKGVSPPLGRRGQGALALLRNGNTARGGAEILSAGKTDTAPEPANARNRQRHVGDDTADGGGPTSAKRHLSESWGGDAGVKGRSRLAGARSAALEARIATPHHHGTVATGRSPFDRGCAERPCRGRPFVGRPGASRLFGGRCRAGS